MHNMLAGSSGQMGKHSRATSYILCVLVIFPSTGVWHSFGAVWFWSWSSLTRLTSTRYAAAITDPDAAASQVQCNAAIRWDMLITESAWEVGASPLPTQLRVVFGGLAGKTDSAKSANQSHAMLPPSTLHPSSPRTGNFRICQNQIPEAVVKRQRRHVVQSGAAVLSLYHGRGSNMNFLGIDSKPGIFASIFLRPQSENTNWPARYTTPTTTSRYVYTTTPSTTINSTALTTTLCYDMLSRLKSWVQ
ncbi:hypothetical protein B0T17DRAFT_506243 [Bombardia bombarda]|uniref:Uncharacterized protein n=1 Tax=Bombardia bombarda TaxID=252184 RepID=A0AA39X9C5_9PEZI|nr:hypothetical protein B0T17DRAFT_506243 [Bombardia bombarda]